MQDPETNRPTMQWQNAGDTRIFKAHVGFYEFDVQVGEECAGDVICGMGYRRGEHLHMNYFGGVTGDDGKQQFHGWGDAREGDTVIYLHYRKYDGTYYVTPDNLGDSSDEPV